MRIFLNMLKEEINVVFVDESSFNAVYKKRRGWIDRLNHKVMANMEYGKDNISNLFHLKIKNHVN